MLERITKQTLIISVILVLLASMILVSVLSLDNKTYAEEDEEQDYVMITPEPNSTRVISEERIVVNFDGLTDFNGYRFIIEPTVNEVSFYTSRHSDITLTNSKITIEPRTTELIIDFAFVSISGPEQEATIYNKSTDGCVKLFSFGWTQIWGNKTSDGSYKDGYDVYGAVATRGDLTFTGYSFMIHGGTNAFTTKLGNLSYGGTALQVFGMKTVRFESPVLCIGGVGANGDVVGKLGFGGGHGGYAYDGALSNIVFDGENACIGLQGGEGGIGASVPKGGIAGKGGKAGNPYYLSFHSNNPDKILYEECHAGKDGSIIE